VPHASLFFVSFLYVSNSVIAKYVVINEKITTAQIPIFSRILALLVPMSFDRFISNNIGIATAGRITAWNAC
jgi:hypothetical protein